VTAAALRRLRSGLTMLTGTAAGASALLAVLVIASVFVSVAMPRASASFRTKALDQIIAKTPPIGRAVVATADFTTLASALAIQPGPLSPGIGTDEIVAVASELAGNLRARRVPLQPVSQRWWGLTSGYGAVPNAAKKAYFGITPPKVEVLYRRNLGRYSRLLAGTWPARDSAGSGGPRFQVAVTPATAARFELRVGSVLKLPGQATLAVAGIIQPVRPRSAFWTADPDAAGATFNQSRSGTYWLGGVFIGPAELVDLENALDSSQMTIQWQLPLRLNGVGADQVGALSNRLAAALNSAGLLTTSVGIPTSATMSCGLADALTGFAQAEKRIASLLALLEVSLTIVGAVVLLLGGWLLAERRAGEFRLMCARGASRRQLAAIGLRAGVVVVIPAAVAATAIAVVVTPAGSDSSAWWLAAVTALAALVSVPLFALRQVPAAGLGAERSDSHPTRRTRARRAVTDLTLALAAVGVVAVLRQEVAARSSGSDWFTSAAPVLVAIPVAIAAVRLYPIAVRWLVRLTGRRHSVTMFLGLARAARTSLAAVLPAFALVLVLAVIAFGATLRAAVVRGDVAESWRATGADVVIDADRSNFPLDGAARRAIAAVPGVQRSSALGVLPGVAADGTPVAVVVVDPASYAALIAATPQPPFPAAALAGPAAAGGPGPMPVLASPSARRLVTSGRKVFVGDHYLPVTVTGTVRSVPGSATSGAFIVAPARAMVRSVGASEAQPSRMLVVGPDVNVAAMRSVVAHTLPAAALVFRSGQLASLTQAPLPHGTYTAFAEGAAAAAVFGAVVVLIMLALGARSREQTLARLFTMGLSPGQARRLVITEALPSIIAATVGGAVCAWLLAPLVGPAIDLSPLTGSAVPVPVRPDYGLVALLAAGLLVLAMVTLFAQSVASRLRGISRALRVGE
jgi:putative ABC transport system permease protein